jgi:hypothetical protein
MWLYQLLKNLKKDNIMREFFQTINEYSWTTFFLFIMIITIIAIFKNDK